MQFTRSDSGLSNLALFCDVDIIVYTEGGEVSYTIEDIIDGKYNNQSVDIKFWSSVFEKHHLNKTVQFRALGSKSSLIKICDLIIDGNIHNVAVTLDSDLDEFIGGKYSSPYILYTRGYSWENDVFHPDLVRDQIANFVFTPAIPQEYIEILNTAYSGFNHQAPRLLKLELLFRRNSLNFITNCKGERFIDGKTLPLLKIDQILNLIKQRKALLSKPITLTPHPTHICPVRYCYGKLREALAIALISYICKKVSNIKTLPKDLIVSVMIERYQRRPSHEEDTYYIDMITSFNAA